MQFVKLQLSSLTSIENQRSLWFIDKGGPAENQELLWNFNYSNSHSGTSHLPPQIHSPIEFVEVLQHTPSEEEV